MSVCVSVCVSVGGCVTSPCTVVAASEIRPLILVLECSTDSSCPYFILLQSRAGSLQCERTAPGVGFQLL